MDKNNKIWLMVFIIVHGIISYNSGYFGLLEAYAIYLLVPIVVLIFIPKNKRRHEGGGIA